MNFTFNKKNYTFKPKFVPLVSFVIALLILLSLSLWQVKRLVWKTNLIEQRVSNFEGEPKNLFDIKKPNENEFKKVFIEGQLLNNLEFFMPALSKNGNNGFHIIVPMEVEKKKLILFDTGWVPLAKKEKNKRLNNLIKEKKIFTAVIRLPGRKGYFQPDNDNIKNFWFFVEPKLMEETISMKLENRFYLEAVDNGPNGYPLGNQTRIYLRNNHLQYAITWFLIALSLIGVFIFASIRKK
jgi:surfeit locus 1 family protein|tara:strand:- start:178 stop:894 length:717 start_codon:yes stop_codon:yes gene_type:complete